MNMSTAKKGRPSDKTEAVTEEFLDRIMMGESMRSICRDEHMPDPKTICRWLRDDEVFCQQYVRARSIQAHTHADDVLAISRQARDKSNADAIRVQVDALKWAASKMNPKVYGDKLDVTSDGDKVTGVTVTILNAPQPSGEPGI